MNELVSMLIPTYTLPGWPPAPEPSVMGTLGLLVGFPALAFIVIFAIAKIGTARKGRHPDVDRANGPFWINGRPGAPGEVAGAGASQLALASSGSGSPAEVGPAADPAPAGVQSGRSTESGEKPDTGGVSARW